MDAGPQQFLGPANAMDRTTQLRSERGNVRWRTIGQGVLCFGPDELIRIKFRSIRGEAMNMKPLMLTEEISDDDAPVNRAAVPKEHHRPTQMPEKVAQESDDLHAGDVDGVETKVQSETPSGWGHGDTGDDGYPIPPVAVFEKRGLSDRRPKH